MTTKEIIYFIPGLDNNSWKMMSLAAWWWRVNHGVQTQVADVPWRMISQASLYCQTQNEVARLADKGGVSVVGVSAGGHLAVTLLKLLENHPNVHKAISVAGRLQAGTFPPDSRQSLQNGAEATPAFLHSLLHFQDEVAPTLSTELRQRVLVVKPLLGDEVVPPQTMGLRDSYQLNQPTGEHLATILAALTILSQPLAYFLLNEEKEKNQQLQPN